MRPGHQCQYAQADLGLLDYDGKSFRQSTLDTIAAYLGFRDWQEAEQATKDKVSAFGHNPAVLDAGELKRGDVVSVTYAPDREIAFEYQGDERFTVAKSVNSKLCAGDVAVIRQFVLGYPLLVTMFAPANRPTCSLIPCGV